mmetsp:Transcript_35273/g.67842  ORF Transcript_35273/g.67842 Transcript_35273/m.67842 type:complete len:250 (-) Transcript_35273:409-1158(-)
MPRVLDVLSGSAEVRGDHWELRLNDVGRDYVDWALLEAQVAERRRRTPRLLLHGCVRLAGALVGIVPTCCRRRGRRRWWRRHEGVGLDDDAGVQRLHHAVVEGDAVLRGGKRLFEPINLPLAHGRGLLEQIPGDGLGARRSRQRAVPVPVAASELVRELLVEVGVVLGYLGGASRNRERVPKVVQDRIALAKLVEEPDDCQAVIGANQRGVVELVDEVGLQRKALAVNGVLRRRVPMDLVEVKPVGADL